MAGTEAAAAPVEFAAFVREHTRSLYATAYLLARTHAGAEDLLQDTLSALFPKWRQVQAAANPVAYVRRSLSNRFVSSQRPASAHEQPRWELPDQPAGVDVAEQVAVAQTVWQLLGELPERMRTALVLRYFHDWSDIEIAEALGCRRGTARSLVSRGLAAMKSRAAEPASTPDLAEGQS